MSPFQPWPDPILRLLSAAWSRWPEVLVGGGGGLSRPVSRKLQHRNPCTPSPGNNISPMMLYSSTDDSCSGERVARDRCSTAVGFECNAAREQNGNYLVGCSSKSRGECPASRV
ncbi:unnamed protein product [Ectocarpus sp. 12 AP-2014]